MEVTDPADRFAQFPPRLDKEEFKALLSTISKAETPNEKGRTLEDLVEFLLRSDVVDMRIHRNVRTIIGELDLVVAPKSFFKRPRKEFCVECKNWAKKVGPNEIAWFAAKVFIHGGDCGLFFARKGVTGDNLTGARGMIRVAKYNPGVDILVVTENDLQRVLDCEDFDDILLKKLEELNLLPTLG
jgi:hypothetical protein